MVIYLTVNTETYGKNKDFTEIDSIHWQQIKFAVILSIKVL